MSGDKLKENDTRNSQRPGPTLLFPGPRSTPRTTDILSVAWAGVLWGYWECKTTVRPGPFVRGGRGVLKALSPPPTTLPSWEGGGREAEDECREGKGAGPLDGHRLVGVGQDRLAAWYGERDTERLKSDYNYGTERANSLAPNRPGDRHGLSEATDWNCPLGC